MSHVRRSANPWPVVLGLALLAAAAAGFFGLTGVAPRDALTVVVDGGGRARAVAAGRRYFRPPGAMVMSEPHAGALQFPADDT